jgi:Domain of unknown function (DUF397)
VTGVVWRKASGSGAQDCVEVAYVDDRPVAYVAVRDSKAGDGSPALTFGPVEWLSFLAKIRAVSS